MEELIFSKNKFKENGFTLIELLVSIGLVMAIAGVSITAFISLTGAYNKADVVTQVNHEGLRVMEQLVRTIRSAEDATSVYSNTGVQLTIPNSDSNLEYASNGNCSTVTIYISNGKLYKKTSNCEGTSTCSSGDGCELTSSTVSVNGFTTNVDESVIDPDKVSIILKLTQSDTSADVHGQAALEFNRIVVTRGY